MVFLTDGYLFDGGAGLLNRPLVNFGPALFHLSSEVVLVMPLGGSCYPYGLRKPLAVFAYAFLFRSRANTSKTNMNLLVAGLQGIDP